MTTRLNIRGVPELPTRAAPTWSGLLGVVSVMLPLLVVAAFSFARFDPTWRGAWDATQRALLDSGTLPSLVVGLAIVLAGLLVGHAVLAAHWTRVAPELSEVGSAAIGQGEDDLRWAETFRGKLRAGELVRRSDDAAAGDPGSGRAAAGRGTVDPA